MGEGSARVKLAAAEPEDLPVPGQPYIFNIFRRAQALKDLESLRQHGRRVMGLHLHGEVSSALEQLRLTVASALPGGEQ
jgi:transaldolase / glucose-6-phosphate isomerase